MDLRLLIVLLPVVAAATWAAFNIFVPAKAQADKFLNQ